MRNYNILHGLRIRTQGFLSSLVDCLLVSKREKNLVRDDMQQFVKFLDSCVPERGL